MVRRCFYVMLFQMLITTTALFGQKLSLPEIRKDFKIGHKDEATCKKHLNALEEYADCPVERGYEAAYHMFMANHIGNPFKKMGYFKNGKKMLEEEIARNPSDIELRYIRLCIQYYIPSFLGYKGNIEEDKDFLVNNLYKLKDQKTKELIYTYLKGAKMYSEAELALLGR
ncbi:MULTISPECIES: hypothetical protein [Sphingobacterium]|uniref:Sel1 repeat family protein n=2 Tax=Sphingobacterium TaxID=28453 RepID=A0A4V2DCK7_9SPHI|nr:MULTISPECIES: hypothetical protein [Sphingobacterium]MBD1435036.1 hypothetical protein [Sphingobacterium micropteri]RZF61828.1 hypothetical protein EWE74_03080 [Sphingobacterium corticibacterium]